MAWTKGSITDTEPTNQPEGSWRRSRNILLGQGFDCIKSERGFDTSITSYNGVAATSLPLPIIGRIPTADKVVFFSTGNGTSEIGVKDSATGAYVTKIKDPILNFSQSSPIEGVFKFMFNGQLIVAWCDGNESTSNPPRIANLDNLAFDLNPDFSLVDPANIILLNFFPEVKIPHIDSIEVKDSGGALSTAIYHPVLGYELADGSATSWLKIYNAIPIVDDAYDSTDFKDYDGAPADVPTSKMIKLNLTNVDTRYTRVRLGIISVINGVKTATLVATQEIAGSSSITMSYTGTELTSDLSLDEIVIPKDTYIGAKTITTVEDKLYFGNVTKNPQIDYQKFANAITAEWVHGDPVSMDGVRGSFKDASVAYLRKQFLSDEVVALYMAFRFKDGTLSTPFHIPGRDVLSNERDPYAVNTEGFRISANAKKFHLECTATDNGNGSGKMGFWENENETYNDANGDWRIFATDGAGGGIDTGVTLRGEKVRHHRMPSLSFLQDAGYPLVSPYGGSTFGRIRIKANTGNTTTAFKGIIDPLFTPTTVNTMFTSFVGGTNCPNTLYMNTSGAPITVRVRFRHIISGDSGATPGSFITTAIRIGGSTSYTAYNTITNLGVSTYNYDSGEQYVTVNLLPNDTIQTVFVTTHTGGGFSATWDPDSYVDYVDTPVGTTTPDGSTFTKPLHIKLSNIYVPDDVRKFISHYEFFYAKREPANSTMVGQSLLMPDNWQLVGSTAGSEINRTVGGIGRFHPFNLMRNKPPIIPSYLKVELILGVGTNQTLPTYLNFETFNSPSTTSIRTTPDQLRKITDAKYLPQNITVPIANDKEGYLRLEFTPTPMAWTSLLPAGSRWAIPLVNICNFLLDAYFGFNKQTLVSTGQLFEVAAASGVVEADVIISNGDSFLVGYGITTKNFTSGVDQGWYFPCESPDNIWLRYEDSVNTLYYYPKTGVGSPPVATPDFFGYNDDYSRLNDLSVLTFPTFSRGAMINISRFPSRIPRSIVSGSEEYFLTWKTFIAGDYHEMPKDKGEVWKIQGYDKTLFINLKESVYIARVKDLLQTNSTNAYLAPGDLFDRKPDEAVTVNEGYAGCESQWSCIVTKHGYVFVDRKQGKVFLLKGELKELSNSGVEVDLRRLLTDDTTVDNPFTSYGVICGFDEVNNRLIVSKRGITVIPGADTPPVEENFTATYNFDINAWVCLRHDYFPNLMYNNKKGLFSGIINAAGEAEVWKHNSPTKVAIYYGQVFQSYIELVHNTDKDVSKINEHFEWIADVKTLDTAVRINSKSFTHAIVFNANQCSGEFNLRQATVWIKQMSRNLEDTWRTNEFRDSVIDPDLPFMDIDGGLIAGNINFNKSWFRKNFFVGKYVIIRYIYDNLDQHEFFLHNAVASVDVSPR